MLLILYYGCCQLAWQLAVASDVAAPAAVVFTAALPVALLLKLPCIAAA